jgi:hypothetical protein
MSRLKTRQKYEALMSKLAFVADTATDSGLIAADRLTEFVHIARARLAAVLGLSRDSVSKTTRVN